MIDTNGVDKEQLYKILKFTRMGREEAKTMQEFIRKHMDKNCRICPTCPTEKRFALKRIIQFELRLKREGKL